MIDSDDNFSLLAIIHCYIAGYYSISIHNIGIVLSNSNSILHVALMILENMVGG